MMRDFRFIILALLLLNGCNVSKNVTTISTNSTVSNNGTLVKEVNNDTLADEVNNEQINTNNITSDGIYEIDASSLNIFDVVSYGKYEQDNDLSNGPEDIEWYVLNNDNGKLLLLSKYVLDAKPLSKFSGYWSTLDLRKWLNEDFYEQAFPTNNKLLAKKIESNQDHLILGNTKKIIADISYDKVFLLNKFEFSEYVQDEKVKTGKGTDYAKENGLFISDSKYETNGRCMYWLTSAQTQDYEGTSYRCFVDTFNVVHNRESRFGSIDTLNSAIGVRPCIIYDSNIEATQSDITNHNATGESIGSASEAKKYISLEDAEEFFKNKSWKSLNDNYSYAEQNDYRKVLNKNGKYLLNKDVVERDYTIYDANIEIVNENELIDFFLTHYNSDDMLHASYGYHNDLIELEFNIIKDDLLNSKTGDDYAKVVKSEQIGFENNAKLVMQEPEYRAYFNSNILKSLPVGVENDDYTVRNYALKVYKLGKELKRTDFKDGIMDNDGNGIDDRDAINSFGCYDLNYDGVDDRSVVTNAHGFGYVANGDLEIINENRRQIDRLSYLCEHNVVNTFFLQDLSNFTETNTERPLCDRCFERILNDAKEYQRFREAVDAAGGASEYAGYRVGSTAKFGNSWWTYEGNQVWRDSNGNIATALIDKTGTLYIGGAGGAGN